MTFAIRTDVRDHPLLINHIARQGCGDACIVVRLQAGYQEFLLHFSYGCRVRLTPRTMTIGLPLLSVLGIAVAWFLGLGTPGKMNLPRPFDSERWKAADPLTKTRCAMVADLQYRIGLVGRPEAELVELLGDDDDEGTGPPIFYVLCPDLIDFYYLEIEWKDGRVASTRVGLT